MGNGVPLLDLRDISKAFGSVQALTDVDFEVREGEVMALVGDNGSFGSYNAPGIEAVYISLPNYEYVP